MSTWSGPTANLTHRWQMDQANISGATVTDLVGALNGTIVGGVVSTPAPFRAFASTALAFDGSTGYITLASEPIVDAGPWSIGFWTNLPDLAYSSGGGLASRFFDFNTGAAGWSAVSTQTTNPGSIAISNAALTKYCVTTASVLSGTVWAHVVLTFNGTSAFSISINANLVSIVATEDIVASATANTIGCRSDISGFLKGSLYQLVTYSAVMTSAQIYQLYVADSTHLSTTLSYGNAFPGIEFPYHGNL